MANVLVKQLKPGNLYTPMAARFYGGQIRLCVSVQHYLDEDGNDGRHLRSLVGGCLRDEFWDDRFEVDLL